MIEVLPAVGDALFLLANINSFLALIPLATAGGVSREHGAVSFTIVSFGLLSAAVGCHLFAWHLLQEAITAVDLDSLEQARRAFSVLPRERLLRSVVFYGPIPCLTGLALWLRATLRTAPAGPRDSIPGLHDDET